MLNQKYNIWQHRSGGPLWKWTSNSKAVIIGVVSRGQGCARKNSPGVYTRVKQFLPWIFAVTKDGKCKALDTNNLNNIRDRPLMIFKTHSK